MELRQPPTLRSTLTPEERAASLAAAKAEFDRLAKSKEDFRSFSGTLEALSDVVHGPNDVTDQFLTLSTGNASTIAKKHVQRCVCKLCMKAVAASGGIGNLTKHLNRFHAGWNADPCVDVSDGEDSGGGGGGGDGVEEEQVRKRAAPVTPFMRARKRARVEVSPEEVLDRWVSFVANNNVAFNLFRSPEFAACIGHPVPHLNPKKISALVRKRADDCEKALVARINGQRVCLTTDGWKGPQSEKYLSVTACWIDNEWHKHKALLGIRPIASEAAESMFDEVSVC